MYDVDAFIADEGNRKLAALVGGRPYTAFVPRIKSLRRSSRVDAAKALLEKCIEAIAREAQIPLPGATVPRWFFDQLTEIHSKAGRGQDAERVMRRYKTLNRRVERSGTRALKEFRRWAARQRAQGDNAL